MPFPLSKLPEASLFSLALAFLEQGRTSEAGTTLREHLRESPDDGRAWRLLGFIEHAFERWTEACRAFEEASVRIPLDPAAECGLAESYAETRRERWALQLMEGMAHQSHVPVPVLRRAAVLLDRLGQPGLAVRCCRRALEGDDDHARTFFDLSRYLGRCGAPDSRVEASLRRAVSLDPECVTFRSALSGFLVLRGRLDEAATVVSALRRNQIDTLRCRGCLSRLLALYDWVGDLERMAWCANRLSELEALGLDGNSTSC